MMSILGNYVRKKINDAVTPLEENINQLQESVTKLKKLNNMILSDMQIEIYAVETYGKQLSFVIGKSFKDPLSECVRTGSMPPEENIDVFKNAGVFLDLGANIGVFNLTLGALGWKGFAFEASKANVSVLSKSIALNDFDIRVIPKAVHEKTGKIGFHSRGPWGMVSTAVHPDFKFDTIDAICLDDWYKAQNIKNIDFIKIDIEGSEVAALRGGQEMLAYYNFPVIFCEINLCALAKYGETQLSLFNIIKGLGYKAYTLDKNVFKEFHMELFPDRVLRDVWFIKNTDNLKYPVEETPKITNEKTIEQIKTQLSLYSQWADESEIERSQVDYVCFALKDYPQYYAIPEIKALLDDIAASKDKYPLLVKMIEWTQIGGL